MRKNICIILNSKSKKYARKEVYETLDLYREDKYLNEEYELKYHSKDVIEKEYEEFKQKYRLMSPSTIERALKRTGCKDIEEYIQCALKHYGWETLEKYAYKKYKIIRFDGNKSIGLYNPKGYIDKVEYIMACGKYRKFTAKDIKDLDIAEVILSDKTEIEWDKNKDYKSNKLRIKQAINKYANKNTYIAVARVHF